VGIRKVLDLIRRPQSEAALAREIAKKRAEQEERIASLRKRAEALGIAVDSIHREDR